MTELRPFDMPPMTAEQEAQLKRDFEETMRGPFTYRVMPPPPPLTPDVVRQLLRECVTVVKPGEVLILRCPWEWTPMQVREMQDVISSWLEYNAPDVKVLAVPHVEMAVIESASVSE